MTDKMNSGGQVESSSAQDAGGRLAAGRKKLIQESLLARDKTAAAHDFVAEYTALMDVFFQERLEEILPSSQRKKGASYGFAVIAVGGYGRGELCLHSDIDILIVSPKVIPTEALDLAQPMFLPLWDMGLDLGHGFRTIKDCVDLAGKDFQVLASLLDARFLAGDKEVAEALSERLWAKVFAGKRRAFLQWMAEQSASRLKRFGDASMQVEPQLKDGVGGLRDYNRMLWLAHLMTPELAERGDGLERMAPPVLPVEEFEEIKHSVAFLFRARNMLHQLSGRKNDVCYLDLQQDIAEHLGFAPQDGRMAVEVFLARLHRAMSALKTISEAYWRTHCLDVVGAAGKTEAEQLCAGVTHRGNEIFIEGRLGAEELVQVFSLCAEKNAVLSWEGRRVVNAAAIEHNEVLGATPELFAQFSTLLLSGRAAPALVQMLETGVLGAMFPEFGRVSDFIQFDAFHTYPVGLHSLKAIEYLEDLANTDKDEENGRRALYCELWADMDEERRMILLMAALFHDIGKSGPAHEVTGASMTSDILARFHVNEERAEEVAFLVRWHLLLVETATRRDLNDETVVLECAARIQSIPRLRALYLLTYADSRATGPKAWNEWTGRLLVELYDKVLSMLERGGLIQPHAAQNILKTRDDVRTIAKDSFDSKFIEHCLEKMSPRYVLRMSPEVILSHMALIKELNWALKERAKRVSILRAERGVVALKAEPEQTDEIWALTIAAKNQSGLFETITGVLALHDMNIYSADIFVWSDGVTLALFQVSSPPDPLYADEFWTRIKGSIMYAMTGKLSVAYRLEEKRSSLLGGGKHVGEESVAVNFDNEQTDFYTVIEVLTQDRAGLLYEISHCLSDLQIEVHVAKVATHGDHVVDYFYVRDAMGLKIEDQDQIREVRKALLHHLSR